MAFMSRLRLSCLDTKNEAKKVKARTCFAQKTTVALTKIVKLITLVPRVIQTETIFKRQSNLVFWLTS